MTTQLISRGQLDILRKLGLPEVNEKNQWLVLHVKGDGIRAPESWNAKVYTNVSGNMKVVTTDMATLVSLLKLVPPTSFIGHIEQILKEAEQAGCMDHCVDCLPHKAAECEDGSRRIISIDDSGWGFPVGGTLVGLHDSLNNSIHIGEVPVQYYQSPCFEKKGYLFAAANVVVKLLGELQHPNADIFDSRTVNVQFKVCTGYVNTGIVKELKERGFKVETCAIGEPLQSALEKAHAEYISKNAGAVLYYDPKDIDPSNIGRAYHETVEWIKKNNAWHLAKTGWRSMKNLQPGV